MTLPKVLTIYAVTNSRMEITEMHENSKPNVKTKQNQSLVLVTAIYWVLILLRPRNLFGDLGKIAKINSSITLLAFVYIHGIKRYGRRHMRVWFALTFILTWLIETISITYGSPFGNYYYTDLLGIKIGKVPLGIMPAYFTTGYLAWTMGTNFLNNLGTGIEKRNLFLVPFISSFIMVMWDYCFEPIKSTIAGAWVWEDVGAYYGVPISNFFGWFLLVYTTFQLYALYLYRFNNNQNVKQSKTFWILAPIMFLGLSLEYLIYPFTETTNQEIYWSIFLGTIFTMVFTSILNIIIVKRIEDRYFTARVITN